MTDAARLRYPLISPRPPRASMLDDVFERIEASGTYSNHGPEVRRFEASATERLFAGKGDCLAVNNATIGLMMAMRDAADRAGRSHGYALMPAFTFAATAEAALWAGLIPLVCDVDLDDWSASAAAEDALIAEYGEWISVVVPYATFGNAIDLNRYARLAEQHGIGVVIDAAASIGTLDNDGVGFGAGFPHAVVYSMHATKPFAVSEGGIIHSGDIELIRRMRAMANFGFEAPRNASLPGLNAKLPEVIAAMASAKLAEIEVVSERRTALEAAYREALSPLGLQAPYGRRRALGFMPVLLPPALAERRSAIIDALAARGIGAGAYFSPHLGQQSLFQRTATLSETPVADDIAARILSLPVSDIMTPADARIVAKALLETCGIQQSARPAAIANAVVIGGGPAGIAMLTAASKAGRLDEIAAGGLTLVERGDSLGAGRLARYAINSDSTAQTFLTAIEHTPELGNHPAVRKIEDWRDGLGVPLAATGPFLTMLGERVGQQLETGGGHVLARHEALGARLGGDGLWHTRIRRIDDGHEYEVPSRSIVVATGGHQPLDRLAAQTLAGEALVTRAGDRLLQSDEVLATGGLDHVANLLAGKRAPRIVVIGGSTSALTTVALLLRSRPGIPFGAGGITLLHRRPLRPFYHSVEAAHAEGFTDFTDDDICPVSGFVYRLGGFRLEARELVLRMLGVDGRAPDPRVQVCQIGDDEAAALTALDNADLVIAALGYRPRALPLTDATGQRIALAADDGAPLVDRMCRMIGADGQPLPGAYGIGLAAGFVPSGNLGGEKSFVGQANGLWLWQNDVGRLIVDALLGEQAQAAAA